MPPPDKKNQILVKLRKNSSEELQIDLLRNDMERYGGLMGILILSWILFITMSLSIASFVGSFFLPDLVGLPNAFWILMGLGGIMALFSVGLVFLWRSVYKDASKRIKRFSIKANEEAISFSRHGKYDIEILTEEIERIDVEDSAADPKKQLLRICLKNGEKIDWGLDEVKQVQYQSIKTRLDQFLGLEQLITSPPKTEINLKVKPEIETLRIELRNDSKEE